MLYNRKACEMDKNVVTGALAQTFLSISHAVLLYYIHLSIVNPFFVYFPGFFDHSDIWYLFKFKYFF